MSSALSHLGDTFDQLVCNEQLGDLLKLQLAEEADRLKIDFHSFVKAAWPIVEPSQAFVDCWHIEAICAELQDAVLNFRPEGVRYIFNIPPGTAKSLVISVLFNAWLWARNARKRVLAASYGQHLSTRDNLRLRDLVTSEWYQARFPFRLDEDQNTKTRYNTDRKGWRVATSVGGPGTGEHPDVIIIDDPTTAQQAESEADREAANQWFDRTVSSRGIARKVIIIVVMQRLHQEDLSGHLIKRGGWNLVRFPMEYEKCQCPQDSITEETRCVLHKADPDWAPDPRDKRTEPGELLCPTLINADKVKQLSLDLGPYGTAGQLQQRPSPEGGGLFQRAWFKFVDEAPKLARRARGWDTAGTENGGDYTAGVRISEGFEQIADPKMPTRTLIRTTGKFYVEDVIRGQWGPANVDATIKATAELDGKECAQREEKEGGSAGLAVVQARAQTLAGYDYAGVAISGSKITRAKPFRAQCEAGNVYLVRGSWNEEYLRELANFPTAKHDDQVDGSSAAFNAVLLEPKPLKVSPVWGRR